MNKSGGKLLLGNTRGNHNIMRPPATHLQPVAEFVERGLVADEGQLEGLQHLRHGHGSARVPRAHDGLHRHEVLAVANQLVALQLLPQSPVAVVHLRLRAELTWQHDCNLRGGRCYAPMVVGMKFMAPASVIASLLQPSKMAKPAATSYCSCYHSIIVRNIRERRCGKKLTIIPMDLVHL